jgi:hypothetical protein
MRGLIAGITSKSIGRAKLGKHLKTLACRKILIILALVGCAIVDSLSSAAGHFGTFVDTCCRHSYGLGEG